MKFKRVYRCERCRVMFRVDRVETDDVTPAYIKAQQEHRCDETGLVRRLATQVGLEEIPETAFSSQAVLDTDVTTASESVASVAELPVSLPESSPSLP